MAWGVLSGLDLVPLNVEVVEDGGAERVGWGGQQAPLPTPVKKYEQADTGPTWHPDSSLGSTFLCCTPPTVVKSTKASAEPHRTPLEHTTGRSHTCACDGRLALEICPLDKRHQSAGVANAVANAVANGPT